MRLDQVLCDARYATDVCPACRSLSECQRRLLFPSEYIAERRAEGMERAEDAPRSRLDKQMGDLPERTLEIIASARRRFRPPGP